MCHELFSSWFIFDNVMLSVYIMSLLCYRLNNTDNKKKNLFTTLKKTERDKKKLIDTVLKQLRGLVNGTA